MPKKEDRFLDTPTKRTLRNLMQAGMKTAYVRDVAGRIEIAYEAPLRANVGEPCIRTKMKYADGAGGTSRSVIASEESIVGWPGYTSIQTVPDPLDDIDLVL